MRALHKNYISSESRNGREALFWAALDSRAVEQLPCEGPPKEGVTIPRTFRPEGPRVHHHSGNTSAAAKQATGDRVTGPATNRQQPRTRRIARNP